MKVLQVAIERVKPYPGNPRKNSATVAKVAKSIQEFGFQQPIVVDSENVVVVGHTRLQAALSLGLKKVPITIMSDHTPEQIRAYRIMDNRSHEDSEWDQEALAREISALLDAGYDQDLTGFEDRELNQLMADVNKQPPTKTAINYSPGFAIIIDLKDERQQLTLLERLSAEGYKCRALIA